MGISKKTAQQNTHGLTVGGVYDLPYKTINKAKIIKIEGNQVTFTFWHQGIFKSSGEGQQTKSVEDFKSILVWAL